jgi:ketosteroid isomerase-like protein
VSENLELVRSIYGHWERGDFARADGLHPDLVWSYVGGPDPSNGTGLAGMAAHRGWLTAWERWHVVATEYRELDDDRVLV